VLEGELRAVVSALVLFELKRIFLKLGKGDRWEEVREGILLNCRVVAVNEAIAEEGAAVSYGTGLPAMDALIFVSVKEADLFYTTDTDFNLLKGRKKPLIRILQDPPP